ncbi:acyl carrier protein [Nemorincola caseinilytica]|uniref:Acyl carrier protein n=1 Tax=Nemorincola caseinilytica TaxID=2054315 RepID=A0ABP8NL59_9BACT
MDFNNIIKQVNDIFIDVLDNEDIKLTPETTAADVEDWDSLNHIQLVVAIEKHFKMRFTTAEINGWKNVGEMCVAIENRLKG